MQPMRPMRINCCVKTVSEHCSSSPYCISATPGFSTRNRHLRQYLIQSLTCPPNSQSLLLRILRLLHDSSNASHSAANVDQSFPRMRKSQGKNGQNMAKLPTPIWQLNVTICDICGKWCQMVSETPMNPGIRGSSYLMLSSSVSSLRPCAAPSQLVG